MQCEHEDLRLDPSTHVKAGHGGVALSLWCWGGSNRRTYEVHVTGSLAELESSRVSSTLSQIKND